MEFEIQGKLPNLYQCHCSLCRKQSGAVSNAATIVDADQLTWIAGRESVRSWVKDTGFRSDFCSNCGSPVPNPLRHLPYYWVPAGLLDHVGQSKIVIHLHLASKAEWEPLPTLGTIHEELPELEQLITDLKRRPGAQPAAASDASAPPAPVPPNGALDA